MLQNLGQNLVKLRSPVQEIPSVETSPHPQNILTNMDLLLRTLIAFFRQPDRARYLPLVITSNIASLLDSINAEVAAFPSGADDPSRPQAIEKLPSLLQKMDDLYALCLQYGLISFGFTQKIAQEHVDMIRGFANEAESAMGDVRNVIEAATSSVKLQVDAAVAAIPSKFEEYQTSLKQLLDNTEKLTDTAQSLVNEIGIASEFSTTEATNIKNATATAAETNLKLIGITQTAAEQQKKAVEDAEATRLLAQAAERQTTQFASDAKATFKELTDARAAIDLQFKKITEFYGDIEKYQQEMLTVKKEATAVSIAVKESTDKTIAELSTRTETIVQTNESLIDQIKDHLTKAVGISLFRAFGNRQWWLAFRVFGWGALLVLGTVGAGILGYLFADSVATTNVKISVYFARLLIAIPATFLLGFVARQYGRERRAEEEYAFKAAISVSLESYRDLVVKMRKDGSDVEAEFVKELIRDIFDNPTKRLYSGQSDLESPDGRPKPATDSL